MDVGNEMPGTDVEAVYHESGFGDMRHSLANE